jgi:hypothetical protein
MKAKRAAGIGRKNRAERVQDQTSALRFETMAQAKRLVVCIDNKGYAVSLEKRKIFVALRDAGAEKHGLLRIVDESGEDYLYPKASFRSIALPQAVKKAVLAA